MTYHSKALPWDQLLAEVNLLDPSLPVALAVIDLDGFGPFNAAQGEAAGDAVLAEVEGHLHDGAPPGALVAHLRGDEFAVAMPDTSCEEALIALEVVRAAVAGHQPAQGLGHRVTLSIGIAGRPAHGETAEELAEAADDGLVRAKRSGGNKVALHVAERMILKSSYYPRASLHRLTKLSRRTGRPEASLLREALDQYLVRQT